MLLRLIVALANLSATITYGALGVTTPEITRALGVPVSQGVWISDASLIGMICVTPLSAYLVRRFAAHRLLIVCLVGLTLASTAVTLAPTLPLLVLVVFVHGAFASPIAPVTQHLIASRLSTEERGAGMAWWTAGTFAGGILGAVLGAPIAARAGFSLALALCMPFVLATIVLLLRQRHLLGPPPERTGGERQATDLTGAGLLVIATLSLGFILNCKNNIDWSGRPLMYEILALFVVAVGAAVWHYRRVSAPILDFTPLRDRRLAAAVLVVLGLNLVSTGLFETDMLATVLRFDAGFLSLRAGLSGLGLLLGVALAGLLVRRAGAVPNLLLAFVALLAGKAGYLAYGGQVGWFDGLWPAVVSSLGFGMLASLLAAYAFDRIAPKLMASATACFVLAGQIGAALGIASLDTVMKAANRLQPADVGDDRTFLLIFAIEFLGAAALCALLPFFRPRRSGATARG